MQYEVETPVAYLQALEEDWRKEKLAILRELILKNGPEFTEGIQYKMLSYADQKGVIFHLNAQRNYVSLYVGDASKVDTDGSLLQGIDVGKGCLRFKKTVNIPDTQIEAFIIKSFQMWREDKDIGC